MDLKALVPVVEKVSRRPRMEVRRPEVVVGEEYLRQLMSLANGLLDPGNVIFRNRLMAWLRRGIMASATRKTAAAVMSRKLAGPVIIASGAVLGLVIYKKAKSLQPVMVSDGHLTYFYPGPLTKPISVDADRVHAIYYRQTESQLQLWFAFHDDTSLQVVLRESEECFPDVLRICRERISARLFERSASDQL